MRAAFRSREASADHRSLGGVVSPRDRLGSRTTPSRSIVVAPRDERDDDPLDTMHSIERASATRFFDNVRAFVLDTKKISPIIYIWYEGGWLSPPVVTAKRSVGG